MKLEDYDHGERFTATLRSSQRLTATEATEVRELIFALSKENFSAEAGQSVGVIVPGPHAMGQPHHFRLYSLADSVQSGNGEPAEIHLCVRRCNAIDPYSGEESRGIASNFLCDMQPGQSIEMNGPFGNPFKLPDKPSADLLLISIGTGIAPFRAFVARLYREQPERSGRVWLFHGATSGLELLYMNDERDDFAEYYDQATFRAFKALSPRPNWADPIAWDYALEDRSEEIWKMLRGSNTLVCLAGREDKYQYLDECFSAMAERDEDWQKRKQELKDAGCWQELLY